MDGKDKKVSVDISKEKLSVMTRIVIILTISIMPIEFIDRRLGGIVCILAFLIGIGGIIAAIKNRNSTGIIICFFCVFIDMIIICSHPAEGVAREPAKRRSCRSNIKQIHIALIQYSMDYSGNFPPANGAAGLEYLRKYDYLTDYSVYTCPSTQTAKGKGNQPLTEDIVDYVYIGCLNEKSAQNTPILYDKSGNHQDFGNVGIVDGAAKGIAGKEWMKEIGK